MRRETMTLAEWKRLQKKLRKYRNQPVIVDGHRFDSKAEATEYLLLAQCLLLKTLRLLLRQVPFRLPGGVVYRADFLCVWSTGRIEVREVKGVWTEAARIKWRQAQALYPHVKFTEIQA